MAYNLPPPWDSGYALPENVRDEGLQRTGYVTKWMPRGTYDNPVVGSGGYALPYNVRKENYGQGTLTTKWLPRGYVDDPPPHRLNVRPRVLAQQPYGRRGRQVTMAAPIMVQPTNAGSAVAISGMSGLDSADVHPLFTDYGTRAAAILIRSVSNLPPAVAKARLKQMMDAIDPTLWKRAADLTRTAMAQGYRGWQALQAGLAGAMSTGIAAEIVRAGLSRTAPQARSLLGLGCYGCAAALGATPGTTVAVNPLLVAEAAGQKATAATAASNGAGTMGKGLRVGPFNMPVDTGMYTPASWTPAQMQWIADTMPDSAHASFTDGLVQVPPAYAVGGPFGLGYTWTQIIANALPFARFTYPMIDGDPNSGKAFGVFVNGLATVKKYGGSMPVGFVPKSIQIRPFSPSGDILGAIWGAIKSIIVTVIELPIQALDEVGKLACQVLANPAVTIAAAGAAAASGAPPAAGATGASIAQQACGKAPPPYVAPPADSSSLLPVALIGGAALIAILLSSRKKKAPAAAPSPVKAIP